MGFPLATAGPLATVKPARQLWPPGSTLIGSAEGKEGWSAMAQSFTKGRFLTVQEVSEILRVSSMTVYRLIKGGELQAVRVGRSFRVRDIDVDAYLSSRFTQAG